MLFRLTILTFAALLWASGALAAEDITIELKWKHQFQFAGYYAAIDQGYYNEVGLNVTLLEADFEQEIGDRVLSGEAQIGVGTSELILARAAGKPFVALAPVFQHSPYVLLVARASGIDNVHELKGKRIMYEPHATEILAYLKQEGIDPGDVILEETTFDLSLLTSGQVDASASYITDQPFELDQLGFKYDVFKSRSGGIDFYGDTLFTTEKFLSAHPETVEKFLAASVKGWHYALRNPREIANLIFNEYSDRHSVEHLVFEAEQSRRLIMPDVVEIGYQNPGRWRHIADVYADMGMLEPGFNFDGFIYDPNPQPDLTWIYLTLLGAFVVITVVTLIATRFFHLNRRISRQAKDLRRAIEETKVLRGLLPVCAHCKKVRNDDGFWQSVDIYIRTHSEAEISHGICPQCLSKHYPDDAEEILREIDERRIQATGRE